MAGRDGQDEDYFLPLVDQRVFGAGIKRKRVPFVAASDLANAVASNPPASINVSTKSAGERYLDIVLPTSSPKSRAENSSSLSEGTSTRSSSPTSLGISNTTICPTCNAPLPSIHPSALSAHHHTSIRHQLSLPHTQPPSHLPRTHVGLRYLSSYGWDPDSRAGLGREGQGIAMPVKAREKWDTLGLREALDDGQVRRPAGKGGKEGDGRVRGGEEGGGVAMRMNAKAVRKEEERKKKETARLRNAMYGRVDVEAYLTRDNG